MKIITGLGNPGPKYVRTRHNIGFRVVERVAERIGAVLGREKYHGLIGERTYAGEMVLLLKPMTFMNNSGLSVSRAVRYSGAGPADLLVVVDDVNLPLGRLRFRGEGSAGGHNGLKSIIAHLGTDAFPRLRVGVGAAAGSDLVGHVLGSFRPDEEMVVGQAVERAADAVLCFIEAGITAAMNGFNVS